MEKKQNENLELRQMIAKNLHFYRLKSHLTQAEVAYHIGVTYQQIQKYETGRNRVSAEILYRLGQLYGVCVQQFFTPIVYPKV